MNDIRHTPAPTTDQLRDAIDSGQTGEKVAWSDPAAAPLGTDAEAGGSPPTAAERRMEQRPDPRVAHEPATGWRGALSYVVIAAIVLAIIVAIALWS